MPFPPIPGAVNNLRGLKLQVPTSPAGFALQNGTPTIATWTAPNDGNIHRVLAVVQSFVTILEVGGQVNFTGTDPAGNAYSLTALAAALGVGAHLSGFPTMFIQAGHTFSVVQQSALTGGAAVVWAEIWGS